MAVGICNQEGGCEYVKAINQHCLHCIKAWDEGRRNPEGTTTGCPLPKFPCSLLPYSKYAPENQEEPPHMKCGGG